MVGLAASAEITQKVHRWSRLRSEQKCERKGTE